MSTLGDPGPGEEGTPPRRDTGRRDRAGSAALPARGGRVELSGVSVEVGRGSRRARAVDHVDLRLGPGELVGLLGPSGSGKSTLLRLVGAQQSPDHGSVEVDGRRLQSLSATQSAAYRAGIGFVSPRTPLLDHLSALDNVLVPTSAQPVAFDPRMRGRDLLERVGMGALAGVAASRLSDEECRRTIVARALVNRPSLVLCDEPTGRLDSHAAESVLDLLLQLHQEERMTMVLASHEASVVARCDRLVRIRDGRIVADEPIRGPERRETFRRVIGPG